MIRRPPRSTQSRSSAASDVYKRQGLGLLGERRDRSGLTDRLADLDDLSDALFEPLVVGHFPGHLLQLGAGFEVQRHGLACHLLGQDVLRSVDGMGRRRARARWLATSAHDGRQTAWAEVTYGGQARLQTAAL